MGGKVDGQESEEKEEADEVSTLAQIDAKVDESTGSEKPYETDGFASLTFMEHLIQQEPAWMALS